jgi:hypothetical protein
MSTNAMAIAVAFSAKFMQNVALIVASAHSVSQLLKLDDNDVKIVYQMRGNVFSHEFDKTEFLVLCLFYLIKLYVYIVNA